MIDHVYISVTNIEQSLVFYTEALKPLGWREFERYDAACPARRPRSQRGPRASVGSCVALASASYSSRATSLGRPCDGPGGTSGRGPRRSAARARTMPSGDLTVRTTTAGSAGGQAALLVEQFGEQPGNSWLTRSQVHQRLASRSSSRQAFATRAVYHQSC
jgi:catechol 2,3-dioxygenase-like lactoylglutathione lyase family enzyme